MSGWGWGGGGGLVFFFFQAEDGIRDYDVTGVQTCALPIFERAGKINAVGYSYDRKYFYTGINDHGLKLWDAETCTLVRHFNKTAEVDGADFSSDGKWLAIGAGSEIHVYRVSDFSLVHKFTHEKGAVNNLDFNHDNTLLASCSSKGEVFITRTSEDRKSVV